MASFARCLVGTLFRNLHYSLRMMRKNAGLTAAVLATLALGIGATTAIYTVVYAALLAPMPYPKPDQLMIVWSKINGHRNGISAGDFLDWKRQNQSFQQLSAWTGASFNVSSHDQPEQLNGRLATPGYFDMQGIPFLLGRDFLPEEGVPGRDHAIILTYKLWNRLGADRTIIGRSMRINGSPYTVVGVLSPGLADRLGPELTAPLAFRPDQINHDYHWLLAMGRLKDGVTRQQAQADMDAVTAQIAADNPRTNQGWGAQVEPLHNDFLPPDRIRNLWLLLGAVGFVLLITCVNIANLLLAKGASRQREIAIRGSMGAGRRQIFTQVLTESLALAVVGGGLGITLGAALLRAIVSLVPEGILPSEADFHLDGHVLAVALAATSVAGLLFGCAPAWYAARTDPAESLKEGGRSGTGAGSHRLRRGLIIGEFALALALLAGAGLAVHSFWNLTRVDLGVRTDHVLTFSLAQPTGRFGSPGEMESYYRRVLDSVRSVSGVAHAAVVTGLPLEGDSDGMPFSIVGGREYADPSQRPGAGFQSVTPDYFRTFGIQMVRGREFNDQDSGSSVRVAVVNEEFVRRYLGGLDPLRQRISIEQIVPGAQQLGPAVEWQIVGVIHNVRYGGFREDDPEINVPFSQSLMPNVNIGVRTEEDPATMARTIAAAVHSIDAQVALAYVRTMDQVKSESLAEDRFTMFLFASFACVAILLAAVGIYGVMAVGVSQRTREIGVRIALGASKNNVIGLIVREGSILACLGLVLGLGGALLVGRTMQSTLYGVKAIDVSVFLMVAGILLVTALVASYLPARRAAAVDPVQALRAE
jgi:putative ABC transport system permease protein